MKLSLVEFEIGYYYLRLDDETIAIICPSDLPKIVEALRGTSGAFVRAKVNEFYAKEHAS